MPVWNDPALDACLAGLSRQTYPAACFEVIVVDNGAEGDSSEIAACYPGTRLAYQAVPGSYAARNAGISAATGELFAFTDADCVPGPEWIASGVSEITRAEVALLAGRVEATTRRAGKPSAIELYEVVFGYRQEQSVREYIAAYTANLFVRREVFDKAGHFDQSLLSGGDFEFSLRAQHFGFRLAYSPLPVVTTPARPTLGALWRRSARLRGGQLGLRTLRASGAPWLQRRRVRPSRLADFRMIAGYPAPLSIRLGSMLAAAFVRVAFKVEGMRLALGGQRKR